MAAADAPSFSALLGLQVGEHDEGHARATVPAHDGVKQPMGLVHGGVYASAGEELCVEAASAALPGGATVHAQATTTNFLRPIFDGTVSLEARRRHRGRTTQVWEVDVTDDAGRLCALVRVVLSIRG